MRSLLTSRKVFRPRPNALRRRDGVAHGGYLHRRLLQVSGLERKLFMVPGVRPGASRLKTPPTLPAGLVLPDAAAVADDLEGSSRGHHVLIFSSSPTRVSGSRARSASSSGKSWYVAPVKTVRCSLPS